MVLPFKYNFSKKDKLFLALQAGFFSIPSEIIFDESGIKKDNELYRWESIKLYELGRMPITNKLSFFIIKKNDEEFKQLPFFLSDKSRVEGIFTTKKVSKGTIDRLGHFDAYGSKYLIKIFNNWKYVVLFWFVLFFLGLICYYLGLFSK